VLQVLIEEAVMQVRFLKIFLLKIFLIPLVGLAAGLSPASAGLVGTTATVNYDWPALGDVFYSGGSALVAAGGTTFSLSSGEIDVDVYDTSIVITFTSGWKFNTVAQKTFDGVAITDDGVNITGLSLISTNISQFDLLFDSHNVDVNFPHPPFSSLRAGSTISLGVSSNAIPEPSTWAMMLLGFAGLGFAGYRASRRSVA
jgi:hypothetical protein